MRAETGQPKKKSLSRLSKFHLWKWQTDADGNRTPKQNKAPRQKYLFVLILREWQNDADGNRTVKKNSP